MKLYYKIKKNEEEGKMIHLTFIYIYTVQLKIFYFSNY